MPVIAIHVPESLEGARNLRHAIETRRWGFPRFRPEYESIQPRSTVLISTGYRHPTAGNSPRKDAATYRQGRLLRVHVFRAETAVTEESRPHWPDELADERVKYPFRITLTPLYELHDVELLGAPPEFGEAFRLSANTQSAGQAIDDSDFTAAIERGRPLDASMRDEWSAPSQGLGVFLSEMSAERLARHRQVAEAHAELPLWSPISRSPGALRTGPGEPYLFGTKSDGGGVLDVRGGGALSGVATMRLSELWDWYLDSTGAESHAELRRHYGDRIGRTLDAVEDPEVRSVLLHHVRLFSESESVAVPVDDAEFVFGSGQYFALEGLAPHHPAVRAVRAYYEPALADRDDEVTQIIIATIRAQARHVIPRLGQTAFKAMVAEAYLHRCALTEEKVRPTLEAAHIKAFSQGGEFRLDNGLLLRSDMHTLYDRGYISFTDDHRLVVSAALRERFGNGDWLYAREGTQIRIPDRTVDRPNPEFLGWHRDLVFQA